MRAPVSLKIPTLVLFGTADDEQPVDQSTARWHDAFRASAFTDYEIVTIADATHALWLGNGAERAILREPSEAMRRRLVAHRVLK